MRGFRAFAAIGAMLICPALAEPASATNLPSGFSEGVVADGFALPTAFTRLPDGRILVAEKGGLVRLVKNGAVASTPFLDIRSRVNSTEDCGLLEVTPDPNFASNGFVYVLYCYEHDPSNPAGSKRARVSRFTASGDAAAASSETIILGKEGGPNCNHFPVGTDCIPANSRSHTGGRILFAPDGTMFVSLGDGGYCGCVTNNALRSQNVDWLAGKILHVTALGAGLPSNPFWNGDAGANRSKVWALGLRNPFRMTLRPSTNRPYVGDVGQTTWEEINVVPAGSNLGWPCYEGSARHAGYEPTAVCQELYGRGPSAVTNPLVAYRHGDFASNGGSVTGGPFYTGSAFPQEYQGAYFYGDYVNNFIRVLRTDASDGLSSGYPKGFATDVPGPVDIQNGPNGTLEYLAIKTGELRRISYAIGNAPPSASASATPTSGAAPLTVNFSSAGSSDPDGDALTYRWTFGDAGPPQPGVEKTFGRTAVGTTAGNANNDEKAANKHSLSEAGTVTKMSAYLDGRGVGVGSQQMRMAIYSDAAGVPGALKLVTSTVTIADGQAPGWVDFPVPGGGAFLPAGTYWLASHHGGGASNTIRRYRVTAVSGTTKRNADSFADGPSDPFGSASNGTGLFSFTATYAPGSGSGSTSPNPEHTYTSPGIYTATLTVEDGRGGTASDSVVISVGGGQGGPTATIDSPASSLRYAVGDVITYSGSGTDPDDGQLPPGGLSWQVILHHCPGTCHAHPGATTTGASGTLTVDDHGDDTFIEIVLTATDSDGLKDSDSVTIHPRLVNVTVTTSPAGLQIVYDDKTATAPFTKASIVNSQHTINAPSPQGGATFSSWSDGGAQQHNIKVGSSDVTYTATFSGGGSGTQTFGQTTVGTEIGNGPNNEKAGNRHTLPQAGSVTKLSAYLDGQGAGTGAQQMRMAIYADASGTPGALKAVSTAVTIADGQPPGWVDFPLPAPVALPAGAYWLVSHHGGPTGTSNTIRRYRITAGAGACKFNADAFADGPTDPFGTPQNGNAVFSFTATYTPT